MIPRQVFRIFMAFSELGLESEASGADRIADRNSTIDERHGAVQARLTSKANQ
jgi:hypothetical protein